MINSIKSRLYQEKLTMADSKETFTVFNSLLIYDAETPLPSRTSDQTLFDDFVHFFHNKVQKNRHGLIKFFPMTIQPLQTLPTRCLNLAP